jgi:molybdopterin molybdotransferase
MTQNVPLLEVSEARRRLLDHFTPLEPESIPLAECVGRILAEDMIAPYDLPPFPNSAMDGFAVRAADVAVASQQTPAILRVVADVPAGRTVETVIQFGEAARIMTGAPLPFGADCVVPVEDTDFNYRQPGMSAPHVVKIYRPAIEGANVRPAGEDVRQGELVINAGHCLRPQDAGFLSMLGQAHVSVRRRPRVAIFSSGDELVEIDQPLAPGKIHDANSYTLAGLVKQNGGVALHLGVAADDPRAVREILDRAVESRADLILSSAGVSVGALDFVRSVVEQEGSLGFWRVNMRPGKPIAFGHYRNIPFIGLPGNPVSAYVGFEIFVRPALLKMQGAVQLERHWQLARLMEPIESDGRETYLRAIVRFKDDEIQARLTGHQGSGNLRSLVQANALLFIPSGVKSVPSGSLVRIFLLDGAV